MSNPEYFIGLLSGTSIDGIDCVLVDFSQTPPILVSSHTEPLSTTLRDNILTLCADRAISLTLLGETDIALGRNFAHGAISLLQKCNLVAADIVAIGSHGQTVKHHPKGENQFTLQIGDPNTISELTGIATVADFRRKDMAAGGQGAPLTPLFHQSFFANDKCRNAVLNIGGIANVSLLRHNDQPLIGFDTGPGNVLMDSWINLIQGAAYDDNGGWAKSGKCNPQLLEAMMQEAFLALPAPKSTGRELFNLPWLENHLTQYQTISNVDVQATLLEFTAQTIANSVDWRKEKVEEVIVCGGGAHNDALMERLAALLSPVAVKSSAEAGLSPDWVEGVAFAWMAKKTWLGEAIDCQSVTGARHPCILGAIYKAENS